MQHFPINIVNSQVQYCTAYGTLAVKGLNILFLKIMEIRAKPTLLNVIQEVSTVIFRGDNAVNTKRTWCCSPKQTAISKHCN